MSNRVQGYTVVAYPESMPEGWEEKLDRLPFGYCAALHDKDKKIDEEGHEEIKKSHMHFYFQGSCTAKQKRYIHDCLGVSYGENVRSISGLYDYLTHENHPTKQHYDRSIISHSAKWCQEAFEMEYVPKRNRGLEIMQLVRDNGITEYYKLMEMLLLIGDEELTAEAKSLWVMRYMDSMRYSRR